MSPVHPPNPDPYDELPEVLKATVTRQQYWGMGHQQRHTLLEDMTQPDDDTEDDFDVET